MGRDNKGYRVGNQKHERTFNISASDAAPAGPSLFSRRLMSVTALLTCGDEQADTPKHRLEWWLPGCREDKRIRVGRGSRRDDKG